MIRFSVVIPTYNRERLIRRAIDCVLRQTLPCEELLVVDDGSTDNTMNVVRAAGAPVRLIQQSHGGPSKARNRGVSEAVTDWIAFLDSDDLWHPDYLARMAAAIEATGGQAALYFSDVEYDEGAVHTLHWTNCRYISPQPVDFIRDATGIAMMGTHPMLMPFTVFRKDTYLQHGGLWEELWSGEDTHFFICIGMSEPVCAVAGSGGVVTADEGNSNNRLTLSYNSGTVRRWQGQVKMYCDLLSRLPHLAPAHRKELNQRLAHSHWRVARLGWMDGQRGIAIKSLVASFQVDVGVVPVVLWDAALRAFRSLRRPASTPH